MHTGEGVLGRCVAVGERGEVLRVQLADGGPVVAADQLSLRWFRINERDEACAQAWRSGHTSWPVYIHMLSALARMQRAAIGKAAFKTQQDKRKADRPKPAKTKEAGKLDQVKVALMAGYTAMIRAGVPREEAQAWLDEEHAKLPGIC